MHKHVACRIPKIINSWFWRLMEEMSENKTACKIEFSISSVLDVARMYIFYGFVHLIYCK